MSSGSDGKPPAGSSPGRPAADTPQRLVVRSRDGSEEVGGGAADTAVAVAKKGSAPGTSMTDIGRSDTDSVAALDREMLVDLTGVTLSGRYLVTRKVGQGGMGAVYEATHTLIGKRVAVKVLLEKYAKRDAIVARLKQEAQLASSIGHEHIIDITDFGNTDDGRTFVVMEFLEGESLADCLAREGTLPEQRILRIAHQAGSALAAAHAKGIVHRDIKPENLFLLRRKNQDFVKVVDFGISKSLRASDENEEQPRLTQTGMVLGTPLYMSPEQARGDEDLDHRVDVYALGVIMYECATGRVPFTGNNYLSVISQVLNEEPKPVREIRPEISEEFEAIVQRAMAKDRDQRYTSATELLSDLTALQDDPTHSTERAKITGPRRLSQRKVSGVKLPYFVAGVSLLVAAIVILVMILNSGGNKRTPVAAAPADAGTTATLIPDAAVAPPVRPTIKVTITTDPPNADLYVESESVGKSPQVVPFAIDDKDQVITAALPGYDDATRTINASRYKDGQTIALKLRKAKGTPKTNHPPIKQGSAATGPDQPGSELGTNPFKNKR
jgi:serine/threonine protein kinase